MDRCLDEARPWRYRAKSSVGRCGPDGVDWPFQELSSNAADGSALPIEKKTKNRWTIACDRASAIQVKYRLYAREMGVRTNWVERDYGFLTGAATFLTAPEMAGQPHQVRIVPPNSWRDIATALPHPDNDPWTRTA
ncbi:MAG: hypothetical protein ACKN9U_22490, partial [Pirellulaceae bacterium]